MAPSSFLLSFGIAIGSVVALSQTWDDAMLIEASLDATDAEAGVLCLMQRSAHYTAGSSESEPPPVSAKIDAMEASMAESANDSFKPEELTFRDDTSLYGLPMWGIAVAVCISASSLTVFGFVLQKRGASAPGDHTYIGDFVLNKESMFGFLLVAGAGFPMDLLAYSLAPLSLTSPLSGVTVALNLVFAERLLGEVTQIWPDIPATGLIIFGTLLATMSGAHEEPVWSNALLLSLLRSRAVRISFGVLLCVIFSGIGYMWWCRETLAKSAKQRGAKPHVYEVLLPAVVSGSCGCISNIGLKAVGVLLRNSGFTYDVVPWAVFTVAAAALQLNYINRGLHLYPQTVFIPIYTAFLVLLSTVVGSVFYQENMQLMNQIRWQLSFAFGLTCIVAGISLFAFRESEGKGHGESASDDGVVKEVHDEAVQCEL